MKSDGITTTARAHLVTVTGEQRIPTDDPGRDLAVGVIRQALSDLYAVQHCHARHPQAVAQDVREEARLWFESSSRRPGSLEWWAAFTGRPASDYRAAAHRVAEIGPGWRLTEARA